MLDDSVKNILDETMKKLEVLKGKNQHLDDLLDEAAVLAEELAQKSDQMLEETKKLNQKSFIKSSDIDFEAVDRVLEDLEKKDMENVDTSPLDNLELNEKDVIASITKLPVFNPDVHEGTKGTLIDRCTYWWRGLPVRVEVSWIGGGFLCNIIRISDDEVVGRYQTNIMEIFHEVEKDDDKCKHLLGNDYGHMFGIHVDIGDTCRAKYWHWTDNINKE